MPEGAPARKERRIPRFLRATLLSARDFALTFGPFVLIALVLLAGAYWLLKPQPPRRVVLATGPDYSHYAEFGKRYRDELKRYRIEVVLRPTEGSSVNRHLLSDAKEEVDLGFVRGGSGEALAKEEEKGGVPSSRSAAFFSNRSGFSTVRMQPKSCPTRSSRALPS